MTTTTVRLEDLLPRNLIAMSREAVEALARDLWEMDHEGAVALDEWPAAREVIVASGVRKSDVTLAPRRLEVGDLVQLVKSPDRHTEWPADMLGAMTHITACDADGTYEITDHRGDRWTCTNDPKEDHDWRHFFVKPVKMLSGAKA